MGCIGVLDGVSLDHLRVFLAIVEFGSFSAAGRKVGRAQSVVSQTVATLEGQLGVRLFDRGARTPALTPQGRALVAEAQAVVASMDAFKASARGLSAGLEAELSVVVDVMFPIAVLTEAVVAFQAAFPRTPLRLFVEALGAIVQPILDGRCAFGIMGSLPNAPAAMTTEPLRSVEIVLVAAPGHALARYPGPIPARVLEQHVQLVLTDRSTLTAGREFGVLSGRTWRLADLGAKHAFLRAGLGFGGMPSAVVADDLTSGALVRLAVGHVPWPPTLAMSAIYPAAMPPGPAGRWLIDRLREPSATPLQPWFCAASA